jgi:hypothetical protein
MPSFPAEEVARYLISTGANVDYDFVENQGGGGSYDLTANILLESIKEAKKMRNIKNFVVAREKLTEKIRKIEKQVWDKR